MKADNIQKYADGEVRWFGDDDGAVLVDLGAGRLLGEFSDNGYGKYDIWLYASYRRARWILRNAPGGIASWGPFPRCCVWLVRLKDVDEARAEIEEFSGVRTATPDDLLGDYVESEED
jgi:hypothetical protein